MPNVCTKFSFGFHVNQTFWGLDMFSIVLVKKRLENVIKTLKRLKAKRVHNVVFHVFMSSEFCQVNLHRFDDVCTTLSKSFFSLNM